MRRVSRIAGKILQGVVVAAALGAATVLLLPRLLGWRTVTVMSGSMSPSYRVDAVLAIDSVDPDDVREGDVIAFEVESDRPLVTHRVVAIEHGATGLSFVTKGDANEEADSHAVAASAVRGRVVFGVPYLGLFVRAVNNPLGFGLLLVLPGVMLIGRELDTIRRDRRAAKASTGTWPPPDAEDIVAGPDGFDFWTSIATEERYYEELDKVVHV